MVSFKKSLTLLLTVVSSSSAFSPASRPNVVSNHHSNSNSNNPAFKKVEAARAKVESMFGTDYKNTLEQMNMVAGGAQAEEYYEGEFL